VNIAGDLLPPKSAGESCSKFIKRKDGGEMEMAGKVGGKRGESATAALELIVDI